MNLEKINNHLNTADALIIIPPFAGIDRPSLGAHILQACCKANNINVKILYANLLLANEIGIKEYESICYAPTTGLLGERFFSKIAYGINAINLYPNSKNTSQIRTSINTDLSGYLKDYVELSKKANEWVEQLTDLIAKKTYLVVGCSSTFEQTSASMALLNTIKNKKHTVITIIGGANCEKQMSDGIASLTDSVDYIFSGECEDAFPRFMKNCMHGERPKNRIINGIHCFDLNKIPTPNYSEFYAQLNDLDQVVHHVLETWLPYESSRGCWWGQKKQCLFCGCNGDGLKYREKSSRRVIEELDVLMKTHPTNNVCMVDNIMPFHYFKTLLPDLGKRGKKYHFFYEQKSNLSLDKVELLKRSGIGVIQPGIEALSSPLLNLMNKGVSAKQNLNLLRYCKMVNLSVNWNILHSFPNDKLSWYSDTLKTLKSISHLHPPSGVYALSIDRFSPYFNNSEFYGILNLSPIYSYKEVFPDNCDRESIAYHFEADYFSESRENQSIIEAIENYVEEWRMRWCDDNASPPMLHVNKINKDLFLLIDTRNTELKKEFSFLSEEQAVMCLFGCDLSFTNQLSKWALNNNYCIQIDDMCMPLATSDPLVYKEMMKIKNEHNKANPADRYAPADFFVGQ